MRRNNARYWPAPVWRTLGSPGGAINQRILVTGAAGFIGSHVVEGLLDRGDHVVGIDNFDPFYDPGEKRSNLRAALASTDFRLVEADCAELDRVEDALGTEQLDAVVHLAARAGVRPSIEDPLGYVRANVDGTAAMLELARRRGIARFLFGSSSSVYGDAAAVPFREDDPVQRQISPYAATKRAGETLCRTYHHLFGLSVLSLRFFTVYGPRQRPDLAIRDFTARILSGRPIVMFGDGSSERDYTWVDDIVRGVLAAVDRSARVPTEHEIINLGGSRTTSLARLIELIGGAAGAEPVVERAPDQPGDVPRTWADVAKAERLLGYRPSVPIEEGIPRFVEWFRERRASEG